MEEIEVRAAREMRARTQCWKWVSPLEISRGYGMTI
jgi:hypothetical protein